MKLLALDASMAACSVAVHHTDKVLAKALLAMEHGQAEAVAPMVRDVMTEAGISFSDLARIVVTVGPGTFTGVRIGLAMARGLGLALDIPVIGIDTLSAIAANATETGLPILVASDARRDEIYAAFFDAAGIMIRAPFITSIEACLQFSPEDPMQVLGTAAEALIGANARLDLIRSLGSDLPDAANFGRAGFRLPAPSEVPAPLYLRAPDAKLQKASGIRIRSAGVCEAEIFGQLHSECFDTPWSPEDFAKLMAMPGAVAALAVEADEPLGFILTRLVVDEAEIITIGTHPKAQRRRVAKTLLHHQFTEQFHNIRTCFVEVAISNGAARALYGSCGFTETGTRRGYYGRPNGAREDAVIMRKVLFR